MLITRHLWMIAQFCLQAYGREACSRPVTGSCAHIIIVIISIIRTTNFPDALLSDYWSRCRGFFFSTEELFQRLYGLGVCVIYMFCPGLFDGRGHLHSADHRSVESFQLDSLRIGIIGESLWMRHWTLEFHKTWSSLGYIFQFSVFVFLSYPANMSAGLILR